MKIVVTGALGHIGSRLIRELPSAFEDAEIILLDNLSTQRYCSLFNLPVQGRYRFIEADVLNTRLETIFEGAQAVIHLAAITDAANSFAIRDQVEQVNYVGTQKVAQACADVGAALLFLSTTSVYGSQATLVDEDCPDLKPQSPYAESKLKAEQYLQMLGATRGLRFVIYRFGTIFGASIGMRFHTAINKFCWQAVLGQPLTVWRTALHQLRPYLDLSDAVRVLLFTLQRNLFDQRIYNAVTLNASVGQIVEAISTFVPGVAIEYVDSPIMNQLSYAVSAERYRSQGFEFTSNLELGLRDTIMLLKGMRSL